MLPTGEKRNHPKRQKKPEKVVEAEIRMLIEPRFGAEPFRIVDPRRLQCRS